MRDAIVWAYGGGTQTAAIAVLVHRGELPKPDLVVMSDTGREASETWEYLWNVMAPYLAEVGVAVEIAPHDLATKDLYGGADGDSLLLPAFSPKGKLPSYCSGEWKREVSRRYMRRRGIETCTLWLGYSVDEMKRMHLSRNRWQTHAFPLIEKRITRKGCVMLVEQEGLPTPPKSSCWMCPHRRDWQWQRLRDHYPDDWAKAVELDRAIRAADLAGGRDGLFLHESRRPLEEIQFAKEPEAEQGSLFRACDSGYCWV